MQTKKDELYSLLRKKACFEVVKETYKPTQLRVIGRVVNNQFNFWLPTMYQLLKVSSAPDADWTCDISKQYLLHNDSVRYAWRLIFQANDLERQLPAVIATVANAPNPSRVEVSSFVLPGYQKDQIRGGQNARGKGATALGSAVIGPMGAVKLSRGGQL